MQQRGPRAGGPGPLLHSYQYIACQVTRRLRAFTHD